MAWSGFVVGAITLTCVAFFFQAVGFAIPFWVSVVVTSVNPTTGNTDEFATHVSLWYGMSCIEGDAGSCTSKVIEPSFDTDAIYDDIPFVGITQQLVVQSVQLILSHHTIWMVLQLGSTISIFFTVLATLVLICCRCAGIHSMCWFVMSCGLLLIGGLGSLAMSILAAVGHGFDDIFAFRPQTITGQTFPWSVLIFGIGSLLGLAASVLLVWVTCYWRRYGAYEESDAGSIPDVPMSSLQKSKGYDRGYDNPRYKTEEDRREYERYDRERNEYRDDRKYNDSRSNGKDIIYKGQGRNYERDSGRHDRGRFDHDRPYYSESHKQNDNMYRPYSQYRY